MNEKKSFKRIDKMKNLILIFDIEFNKKFCLDDKHLFWLVHYTFRVSLWNKKLSCSFKDQLLIDVEDKLIRKKYVSALDIEIGIYTIYMNEYASLLIDIF
jgi:hypothetical protein